MDDRPTRPGPPGGIRYICPWPGCDWCLDVPPPVVESSWDVHGYRAAVTAVSADSVEMAIATHLHSAHQGWTVDQLRQHETDRRNDHGCH